jgi:hypothetical protein
LALLYEACQELALAQWQIARKGGPNAERFRMKMNATDDLKTEIEVWWRRLGVME